MSIPKSHKSKTSSEQKQFVLCKPAKDYEKIISTLEDEIVRKQEKIDELSEQNKLLLKTVLKNQNKLN